MLKVMAGDVIDVKVQSFYWSHGTTEKTSSALENILASLAQGIVQTNGDVKGTVTGLSDVNTSPLVNPLNLFRGDHNSDQPGKPKAYLNWIFLNEQFKYDGTVSNALPVGRADQLEPLAYSDIKIPKNGYLYIYVSNETQNWDVFFDDFSVVQHPGALLEETHYYPFGLAMTGISSKALDKLENRFKFNDATELENKEFSDGGGLDLYSTDFRKYDPQLGRFWQIDDLADIAEDWSPYAFANDNPILLNDPLGLKSDTTSLEPVIVTPHGPGALGPICYTCNVPAPDPSVAATSIEYYYLTRESFIEGSDQHVDLVTLMTAANQFDENNPDYILLHTVVEERRWYEFWQSAGYQGKNALGGDVIKPIYAGYPPDVSIAKVGGVRKLFNIFKGSWKKGLRSLPALDATGKVHGILPRIKDLRKYSPEELKIFLKDLKESVGERIQKTVELGRDQAHGQRQAQEQQLIKAIEKILDDLWLIVIQKRNHLSNNYLKIP